MVKGPSASAEGISETKDEEVNADEDSEVDGYVFGDDLDASDEARVSAGRSGALRPITRNLAGEFDEVAKPEPACDDSGSENEVSDKKPADKPVVRKLPGNRPPMNSSTPAANRVIGRILDQMMESRDRIRQFTPKAAREALWVELSGELACPVNTMSAVKVAEDTVSLLRAMGFEPQTNPSEAALRDWPPIPLPQTPKKNEQGKESDDDGVFGVRTEGTPYFQDSHMVTPRSSNRADRLARDIEASNAQRGAAGASSGRSHQHFVPHDDSSDDDNGEDDYYRKEDAEYDDPSDELARQVREVSEMERLNSTPRLELVTHKPLAQIKAFSGLQKHLRTSHEDVPALTVVMSGVQRPQGTDIDGTVTTDTDADMTVEWTIPVSAAKDINRFDGVLSFYLSSSHTESMSAVDSTRKKLSPGQMVYVTRCYAFMTRMRERGVFGGKKTRDLVASCLGIAHGTVTRVMDAYNANQDTAFELQPIELIWAQVKGKIAIQPPKNGNGAVEKVLNGLYAIKRKEFINVYRHAQSFENKYAELELESAELRLMACEDKSY
ncbi:unnamed protein product [Phytophthora fragariaefolia]|uniref:Unnamed protein product n=1 Tax=Phytophthora fragariaefolia TaxID=1490495 RepID=A0A9W6YDC3_9STRA|nr:unnamed protein product [Phytophthora fragariaefolia]